MGSVRRRATAPVRGLLAAGLVVAGFGLTGCGAPQGPAPTPLDIAAQSATENGIDVLSSDDLGARILEDVAGQDAVHIAGTYTEPEADDADTVPMLRKGETLTVDRTGTDAGYRLTLHSPSLTAELIVRGNDAWARGNAALGTLLGTGIDATRFTEIPASQPAVAALLQLGDVDALLTSIITPPRARTSFAVSDTRTDPSVQVQFAVTTADVIAGTMTVSGTGPALPAEIALTDRTGSAHLLLSEWGTAPEISAPSGP